MLTIKRTPQDWFQEAARCYVEKHQGCAWCGDSHQVFQFSSGKEVVYYCSGCDFRITYNRETHAYSKIPGETPAKSEVKTMLEF